MSTESRLTLALIHTSPTLAPIFSDLCHQHVPELRYFHMVDESLIQETILSGTLSKTTIRRVLNHIASAETGGADAVLVTCSSIGPAATAAQAFFDFPVLRIDEAMAETAVRKAQRIGVLATLHTTLEPTCALLRDKAAEAGREVELIECLCDEAFPAIMAGETEKHDRILRNALTNQMNGVELIVLAQASMARVIESIDPSLLPAPVLSSPELAVLRLRQVLELPVEAPA